MKLKRIAAILLVFAILTGGVTVVKAAEETADEPNAQTTSGFSEESTQEETDTEQTETTTEAGESAEEPSEENAQENNSVAEMSICTRASGFPAYFHVWIYIHNISEETLRIGAYDLPAGEGVSVGSWGMMFTDMWGVYYNVESFAAAGRDSGDYYSLTKQLTLEEVGEVGEEVRRFNYWDPFFNCTVFAYRVWNCVDGSWLFPLPLPWITLLQLAIYGGGTHKLEMFVPEEGCVFRQKGWGDEAVLVKTEDWALRSIVANV